MLWAHTYPEYYTEAAQRLRTNPVESHEHLGMVASSSFSASHILTQASADHCANLLRQKLECDADMTIITYNWVKGHYMPHPNFNVQHKCRSYDAAKEWTLQRAINASSHEHNYFTRPNHSVVDFEEPPFDPLADS